MRKFLKIAAVLLVSGLLVIQFFRPSFSNPPLIAGQTLEESTDVPAAVLMVITRSCNDCHSNKGVYPWYSHIAPVSWFLANHVSEGRNELNFSEWGTYTDKKKAHKLEEICEQVEAGAMPLPSYLWIHRDAALSADQSRLLCSWAKAERLKLGVE